MSLLYRLWRYGGDDWTVVWRVYHGLATDFRPLGQPHRDPLPIADVQRYRQLLYGFAKAAAVIEEGAPNDPPRPTPLRPKRGPSVTPGGVVLPTGVPDPAG